MTGGQSVAGDFSVDALVPRETAAKAAVIGQAKAGLGTGQLFALAVLAGAFISLGAVLSTTVATGSGALPYGVARLLIGATFSLGLILVVLAGAELFTGNTLIVMAWANRKVSTAAMLRNWLIAYLGNFVGAVATAWLVWQSGHHAFAEGAIGKTALNIANAKLQYSWGQAFVLGVLCNALVCLAVWLSFGARSAADKILAIILPVTAFVAAGFEHVIANMYYLPVAIFISNDPQLLAKTGIAAEAVQGITWKATLVDNFVPVTLGNVLGGSGLVGAMYWFIYLRGAPKA